ncbi:hypothetical protein V865_004281 [Kwoniella europaea PYCC6329]|uniref:Uncharacterized protein n=1 Tax=Kwoniella europaea PYCC6329 TaxID=1423913 RepID=A0AAX4KKY6_9TREE
MSSSKSKSKHQEEDLKARQKVNGDLHGLMSNLMKMHVCKNVMFVPTDGYYVPAGSILPLGAQMPEMTVLQYGGYFPEGTSFPGGVMVPMHARMVNILPEQTIKPSGPIASESMCSIQ